MSERFEMLDKIALYKWTSTSDKQHYTLQAIKRGRTFVITTGKSLDELK